MRNLRKKSRVCNGIEIATSVIPDIPVGCQTIQRLDETRKT